MKIGEIKKLTIEQLETELAKFRKELVQVGKDVRNGKEKNVKKSLRIKRIIARIQTVLNEKVKNNLKDIKNGKEKGNK
jgi:ribosomal protein L29